MASVEVSDQQPVNRSCESCRSLKVRCLPDEASTSGICQRCAKSGRNCVFAAPQKRRQRKRTDTRVAELEKEVRAMRQLLSKTGIKSVPEESSEYGKEDREYAEADEDNGQALNDGKDGQTWTNGDERMGFAMERIPSQYGSGTPNNDTPSTISSSSVVGAKHNLPSSGKDVIDRGLISTKLAYELYDSYNNDLVQHYPGVILPPDCSAGEMRESKPALFLAVITAACCNYGPDMYGVLFEELARHYAERILIKGEKNLELVQALTVTAIWYCPPYEVSSGALQFYQYIHMAATMALDIGLGTQIDVSAMSLEQSRAICTCYLNCASVAMRMRRPNMLRWTSWMGQCLELLETSPASTFLDIRLHAWIKLQIITDDYAALFAFDDPSSTVNLTDSRMHTTLKGFEQQLQEWLRQTPESVLNPSLLMAYHQNSIYLHERIAIDGNFDDKENFNHKIFNPPHAVRRVVQERKEAGPLSATYVNAVMSCIESMHALLDMFLALDLKTLRTVPIVVFVRMSYSVVVLIKLYISTYASNIGTILNRKDLKVDYYLKSCMEKLDDAAGSQRYRVPDKWLKVLRPINSWYRKYEKLFEEENSVPTATADIVRQGLSGSETGLSCNTNFVNAPNISSQTASGIHYSFFSATAEKDSNDSVDPVKYAMNYSIVPSFPDDDSSAWDGPKISTANQPAASPPMVNIDTIEMDHTRDDFTFNDYSGEFDLNTNWMADNSFLGDMDFNASMKDLNSGFR